MLSIIQGADYQRNNNDGYRYHFLYYRNIFFCTIAHSQLVLLQVFIFFRLEQLLTIKWKHVLTVWIIRFDGEARHCGIGHGLCITKETKKVCASREGVRDRENTERLRSLSMFLFLKPHSGHNTDRNKCTYSFKS